ncbi:MAG: 3-hydroxyacyl-CoA dehydrogenase family protein [Solirubrobacteraceae bacterium]
MSTAATRLADAAGAGPQQTRAAPIGDAPHQARAAVIGAGLMGHGIAQVLAAGGVAVSIHDPEPEALASVPQRVAANLQALDADPSAAARITLADSLKGAVANAEWVFEAAPEKLELKQELFAQLDAAAPAGAILATNTSVMSVAEIASRATRRERILGTHWWNPPFLIPLVEVIQAPDTDAENIAKMLAFLTALGKTPVHVKRDVPGFVGNRLQHALWRAAFQLVDEGVCDAATVDTVIRAGFGMRLPVLGPIENADLIGLDLTLDIHDYILPRLNPPSQPSPTLRQLVAEQKLGMKTGEGFLQWTDESADRVRRTLREHLVRAAGEFVPPEPGGTEPGGTEPVHPQPGGDP